MALISERIRTRSKYANRAAPADAVFLTEDFLGVEFEVEDVEEEIPQHLNDFWTVKTDGSLRNGKEYCFFQPMAGAKADLALSQFFEHSSFEVSIRTGLHVHLNMTDEGDTDEVAKHLLLVYLLLEPTIYEYAGEARRWSGFSTAIQDAEGNIPILARMFSTKAAATQNWAQLVEQLGRYQGLNFASLGKFGTIEFRHMPMVFTKPEVVEWINVILGIKKMAKLLVETGQTVLELYKAAGFDKFVGVLFEGRCPTFQALLTDEKLHKAAQYVAVTSLHLEQGEEEPAVATQYEPTTDLANMEALKILLQYLDTGVIPPPYAVPEPAPPPQDSWWKKKRGPRPVAAVIAPPPEPGTAAWWERVSPPGFLSRATALGRPSTGASEDVASIRYSRMLADMNTAYSFTPRTPVVEEPSDANQE